MSNCLRRSHRYQSLSHGEDPLLHGPEIIKMIFLEAVTTANAHDNVNDLVGLDTVETLAVMFPCKVIEM